jgi:hypothetical protein
LHFRVVCMVSVQIINGDHDPAPALLDGDTDQ